MVFWEMVMKVLTGEYHVPFSEYDEISFDFQIIVQSSKNSLRPTIPETCPRNFASLIESCWQQV